jgi:hypothetical protein
VNFREKSGPRRVEDLLLIKGISKRKLEDLRLPSRSCRRQLRNLNSRAARFLRGARHLAWQVIRGKGGGKRRTPKWHRGSDGFVCGLCVSAVASVFLRVLRFFLGVLGAKSFDVCCRALLLARFCGVQR